MNPGRVPVLWHLKVSNFNEKARWALDYKRVPHVRRAVEPGVHRAVARKLSGGRTLPILELDGETIGDSTAIIAALERRHPDPPLYPADPHAWRHALELEDSADFGIDEHSVENAFDKVRLAGERLQADLGPSGYLAGDGFSVADLTLA